MKAAFHWMTGCIFAAVRQVYNTHYLIWCDLIELVWAKKALKVKLLKSKS